MVDLVVVWVVELGQAMAALPLLLLFQQVVHAAQIHSLEFPVYTIDIPQVYWRECINSLLESIDSLPIVYWSASINIVYWSL